MGSAGPARASEAQRGEPRPRSSVGGQTEPAAGGGRDRAGWAAGTGHPAAHDEALPMKKAAALLFGLAMAVVLAELGLRLVSRFHAPVRYLVTAGDASEQPVFPSL
jgi:hypothetical protein